MISQLMGDDDQKMLDHLILTTIPTLVLGAISITITDVLPWDARIPILTWKLPATTKTGLGLSTVFRTSTLPFSIFSPELAFAIAVLLRIGQYHHHYFEVVLQILRILQSSPQRNHQKTRQFQVQTMS